MKQILLNDVFDYCESFIVRGCLVYHFDENLIKSLLMFYWGIYVRDKKV